jgi:lipoprotein-anchoring transpeptidase ErfK/SrfK
MRILCGLCVLCVSFVSAVSARSAHGPSTKAQRLEPAIDLLELQVRLDRAGFSPGEIDGRDGANTRRAAAAFATARNLGDASHRAVLDALGREQTNEPAVINYTVAAGDIAGPFTPTIPSDLMAQASLDALAYRTPLEALAEKFHASPALLTRLNPGARFIEGERLSVPNVAPAAEASPSAQSGTSADSAAAPPPAPAGTAGRASGSTPDVVLRVSKGRSAAEVVAPDGRVIFYAPVTTGSEFDPLPIGEWKVTGVQRNPSFHYNPELFWDADPSHAKATLKPGPNNPVGVVWIDISKPHYGLHGTPEPARVGKMASHGCIRLTNWDALRLAALVRPGTKVLFTP